MYRAIFLKNIDKHRNYMLMLEYNFYKSKQKEKIMKMPEEFKTLVVKSEPLYFKENFEGKEINSELILRSLKVKLLI